MLDYLDKLRQKPRKVRERIALSTTITISSLIAFMWWSTFNVPGNNKGVALSEALSPVGALSQMVVDAGHGAQQFTGNLKKQIEQVQYESSSTIIEGEENSAATGSSFNKNSPPSTQDIVYPEQIFGKEPGEERATTSTPTQAERITTTP